MPKDTSPPAAVKCAALRSPPAVTGRCADDAIRVLLGLPLCAWHLSIAQNRHPARITN